MRNSGFRQALIVIVLSATSLVPFAVSYGQNTLLRADYPQSYIVGEGDTLWIIAGQFLQDPERWSEIWKPDTYLDNPDLIFPGDILRLSTVGRGPRILLQRGDRATARLTPEIREEPLSSAIPAIPLEAIENSFSKNRIVTRQMYDAAPYIVAHIGDKLILSTGDEVYARGSWPVGTNTFEVYREGRVYKAENGKDLLGLELEYLGFASIVEEAGPGLKKILINSSAKEVKVGDRLLIREESSIDATIFPTVPASRMEGQIIAFLGEEALASQLDTVVVDLGLRDNLEVGDILSIQHEGTRMTDEVERSRMSVRERIATYFNQDRLRIPGKEIGTLLVYKTFAQLSYAVILSSTEPAELYNEVVSP